MKWFKRALAALVLLAVGMGGLAVATALTATRPVGFQQVVVSDGDGGHFALSLWYPTTASPRPTTLIGTRLMTVAKDAPVAGERLPLVLISHGNGGGARPGFHDARPGAERGCGAGAVVERRGRPQRAGSQQYARGARRPRPACRVP